MRIWQAAVLVERGRGGGVGRGVKTNRKLYLYVTSLSLYIYVERERSWPQICPLIALREMLTYLVIYPVAIFIQRRIYTYVLYSRSYDMVFALKDGFLV